MKLNRQTLKSYSRDFEFGIFQSIGFKEFDDYFNHIESGNVDEQKEGEDDFEVKKQALLNNALTAMKVSTRRYAKIQIRWVKNRFIKSKIDLF
jgi:tRNA dimethylallyltransferase